ncbi:nucleotidyltransferase family protein [Thermodesulfobacteriota bacterium]
MTRTERENRLCRLIARQTLNKSDAAWLTKYITEGMDWSSSVAQAAFSEGLSSLLYYHCRNLDLLSCLPAGTRKQLGRIYAETSIINRHVLRTMDELADELKKRNLHVIVFKGASLLNTVYHDPALRPMEDIDLLVQQERMEELKDILEAMGFVQNKLYTDSYNKGLISFDLHTDYLSSHRIASRRDILDIKTSDVWRTATPVSGGTFLGRLSLYDTLIALSFHLLKHRYTGLIGFVDIAEVIKKYQSVLNWPELVEYSRMVRAERILLYVFLLMKHLVGFGVPNHVLIDLGKERLSIIEETLLRLRLIHAEPDKLMNILWIFQVPGVGKKIRFVKENIFPRREVMNQIFPASFPRVHVFLRRAIAAFSQVSSDGASAFKTAVKGGLPPL